MSDMTAIILAAGLGIRMGPRGRLCPKGLIEVGGETMVAQSLSSLRAFGIGRVRIVTGHLDDQYRAAFGTEPGVELVHNPAYGTTGSLRSLAVGLDGVEGACVILESDLIYAPEALEAALTGGTCLIASGPTGAGDEVYIWTDADGGLLEMSKDRAARPEPPHGELVGITGIGADAVPILREVAGAVMAAEPAEHYEPGLVALARKVALPVLRLDGLAWAEIDDEDMLARAERLVVPRVQAARAALIPRAG